MSDSSDEGEPFQLRDREEDSDEDSLRPNKRRKIVGSSTLRSRGLGFVQAAVHDEDDVDNNEEEDDIDDARPTMGGFQNAFNIGEYNVEDLTRSPTPETRESPKPEKMSGTGPSAFSAGGRMNKSSFAARMMAKMGHVEGKGLGKSGQGIAAPIEARVLDNKAGLGAGSAPERPKKTKQQKGTASQSLTPGTHTPRIKALPKKKYEVAAIESRGLYIPAAMKSIIIDATGPEARTVSSVSGFSTPTATPAPVTEEQKAQARIKLQLQAYADAWDSTKEHENRLEMEEGQLEAAGSLHAQEIQRYQDIISAFERVSMDDSGQSRDWDHVILQVQDIQNRFADYIEELELPEFAISSIEAPFKKELLDWNPLSEPSHLISSIQSVGALMEIEKSTLSRHRKRTTAFESLLLQHWFPKIRSAFKDWDIYDPDKATSLIMTWQPILAPWLTCKILDEIVLPKLIEGVRRFPKSVESAAHGSRSHTNGSKKKRTAPDLHSWLFDWWSLLSSDSLALDRFPELKSLIKAKVDSHVWPMWKPLLGSRRPAAPVQQPSYASSLPTTPAATAPFEEISFRDIVEEWCSENDLTLRSTGKSDVLGRLLFRLQDADRRSKGILVYLQEDVVFAEDGEPFALDDTLAQRARSR